MTTPPAEPRPKWQRPPGSLRVFGWSADMADGCFWYRLRTPFAVLAERGHTTIISTVLPEDLPDHADILVGQRICLPGPTKTWQALARQENRPALVYEIDDDLFNVDPSSYHVAGFFANELIRKNLERNIQVADLVTVSTAPLAERLSTINPNVAVLPNLVPSWLVGTDPPARQDGTLTLGWQGSNTHMMDWDGPNQQVERFLRRNPHVELHTLGAECGTAPRTDNHRHTRWSRNIPAYYHTIDWHIALAPLRPHPFNNSKSPLRVLEAGALGIPVVASAAGPYETFIEHGRTGLVVRHEHEWGRHLWALANDPAMRAELGANLRTEVARWYLAEHGTQAWEDAYHAARR